MNLLSRFWPSCIVGVQCVLRKTMNEWVSLTGWVSRLKNDASRSIYKLSIGRMQSRWCSVRGGSNKVIWDNLYCIRICLRRYHTIRRRTHIYTCLPFIWNVIRRKRYDEAGDAEGAMQVDVIWRLLFLRCWCNSTSRPLPAGVSRFDAVRLYCKT